MLLTDLLQGRKNRWEDLYSPSRITLRAIGEFAGENLNVAGQFTDYLTAGEIKSVDELKPGCGAIMREGLSKLAAYRDEGGVVHKLSAVCPHLGCIVAWNSTEKTWDCPCHGSKYRADGRVYQGPANSDLSEA
jgi:Rieske Fe-S protein